MSPLLYVTLCSIRNRIRVRLRRLKEPRYLIGAIVGVGYFWMVLWRPRAGSRVRGPGAREAPAGILALIARGRFLIEIFGAVALFGMAALAWLWPGKGRPALAFTRAEVQFFFTAPLTRRQLIRYKILRSQLGALMGSALMTVLFRPTSAAEGWIFFGGIAIVMTIVNLHLTGVSLRRESLASHGSAGLTRQWLPVALVGGAAVILVATVAMDWRLLVAPPAGSTIFDEIERLAASQPLATVLWPFRVLVRLPLSATPADFIQALPLTLLILALNYIWVVRSDASFEEASAEASEKLARVRLGPQPTARLVNGAVSTPFHLGLQGPAEVAILWKNLILVSRYVSLRVLLRFLLPFLVLGIIATRNAESGWAGIFGGACLIAFIMSVLLGPQLARNDLRQDLANLAVLKSWPVRGATLVRGEVLAPAAMLVTIAWCAALGGFLFASRLDINASMLMAAILLSPGLIVMQLLFQNAIAVLWPAWVVVSSHRARGIDVMGQRMIMMFGLMLALAVAILPAAVAGGIVVAGLYWTTGHLWIVGPAAVAAIVLFMEAFAGSEIIGRLFERTDVNAVDATES